MKSPEDYFVKEESKPKKVEELAAGIREKLEQGECAYYSRGEDGCDYLYIPRMKVKSVDELEKLHAQVINGYPSLGVIDKKEYFVMKLRPSVNADNAQKLINLINADAPTKETGQ